MTSNTVDLEELTEVLAISHGFSLGEAICDPKGNFVSMFRDKNGISIIYKYLVGAKGVEEIIGLMREYIGYSEEHREVFYINRDCHGQVQLGYVGTHPFFLAATFSGLNKAQLDAVSKSDFLARMHAAVSQNYHVGSTVFTISYEKEKNDVLFGEIALFFLERFKAKDRGIEPMPPNSRLH